VTSDPAQPARAAVIINSIIVVASKLRMSLLEHIVNIYFRTYVNKHTDLDCYRIECE